jgi:hypothetical protein
MLVSLLVTLAAADSHVPTFKKDPAYTPAPFAGLERLYVDPATTVSQVAPQATRPAGESVKDVPEAGSLAFTNPLNQWGELTVNGTPVGTIGPFVTCHLAGFRPGWYAVGVGVTTGFTRHFAVEVK